MNAKPTPSDLDAVKLQIRALWIILVGMIGGELMFAAVVFLVLRSGTFTPSAPSEPAFQTIFHAALTGLACVAVIATVVSRTLQPKFLAGAESPRQAAKRLFTARIIPAAIAEVAGIFCLVMILMGGNPATIIPIWIVTLVCLITHFPSTRKLIQAWDASRSPHRSG